MTGDLVLNLNLKERVVNSWVSHSNLTRVKSEWICVFVILITAWLQPLGGSCAEQDPLDTAFQVLHEYEWGPARDALAPIELAIATSHGNVDARRRLENRLVEVLRSAAPRAAKSYVCRQLRVMGTLRSVPALAELLSDTELAHMARSALEVIPGDEASQALLAALPQLDGDLKVGLIHSLGRRGDMVATAELVPLVHDRDPRIAGAAVKALAKIPSDDASDAILAFRKSASAELDFVATEASLHIARRWLEEGEAQKAAGIYKSLESSEHDQFRCAALRGLVEAEPASAGKRLMEALSTADSDLQSFCAQIVREWADDSQTEVLARSLGELPLDGQVRLLDAFRGRRHPAVRDAALESLKSEHTALRLAALRAMADAGGPSDVAALARLASGPNAQERVVAAESLHQLHGSAVDEQILQLLGSSETDTRQALIRAVVARRISNAGPRLIEMAEDKNAAVRIEAFTALQAVADVSLADELVRLLANAPRGKEREAADRAVWRSCSRITDQDRRADPILAALATAEPSRQAALLPALGRVGGVKALEVIHTAMKDPNEKVRDAAVRGLCNWPDATVADELLELARKEGKESHRIWALRGFVRVIARQGRDRPQQVYEGLHQAMLLSSRLEEQKLILSRLTAARVPSSLTLSLSFLTDDRLRSDAIETTVSLAEGMKDSHPKEARAALEKVHPLTKNAELQLYIVKLLWNMQLKGN
jgi:HEAT repeat protein